MTRTRLRQTPARPAFHELNAGKCLMAREGTPSNTSVLRSQPCLPHTRVMVFWGLGMNPRSEVLEVWNRDRTH